MANSLITNQIVTYEALDVLENTDAAMRIINGEYSDNFEFGGAVIGQTLNIRNPPRYFGRLGQAAQIEAITEPRAAHAESYQRGVDTEVSSQQLTLDIDDYREARSSAADCAAEQSHRPRRVRVLRTGLNNFVGTPGVTPSTLTTYGLAKVKLDNMAAPDG